MKQKGSFFKTYLKLYKMKTNEKIDLFLSEADVNSGTRQTYYYGIRKFVLWLYRSNIDIDNVSRSTIIEYKNFLINEKLSATSIKNYYTIVRLYFQWARLNNLCDDPTLGIRLPKHNNAIKKNPLTTEEAKRLFQTCDDSPFGKRNLAMLHLLLVNGIRRNELTNINIGDVELRKGQPGISIKGKGRISKDQWIYLTDFVYESIQEWLKVRPYNAELDSPLFVAQCGKYFTNRRLQNNTVTILLKKKLREIGLDSKLYSLHSLRHSAASLLIEHGLDILDVQLYLRHASSNTTMLYTRLVHEKIRRENKAGKLLESLLFNKS